MRRILIILGIVAAVVAIGFAILYRLNLIRPLPGMPPVVHRENLYSEAAAGHFSPATAGLVPRVYVPDVKSGDVYVIDPADRKSTRLNSSHRT